MRGVLPKEKLHELMAEARTHGLSLVDIVATCKTLDREPQDVLNELSVAVAERYLQGAWTYECCDDVMNGLFGAIVDAGMPHGMPQPAWSLYQAFDEGERLRSDDPADTDPAEKYTRPRVLHIMRVQNG